MSKQPRRNIVFLSSTGNGKSSVCNTILGASAFQVGNGVGSCTSTTWLRESPELGLNIIDTAGFGDTRFDERNIDGLMGELTSKVLAFDGSSTSRIDAFVLVIKCTPRATSLKADVEHILNIFGEEALKSTVLLLITPGEYYDYPDQEIEDGLLSMKRVLDYFRKARGEDFSADWYLRWDNRKPRPGQLQGLLDRIKRVEPYTHEKFIKAQEEIKRRQNELIDGKIKQETERLQRQFKNNAEKMQEEIETMRAELEEEREEMLRKTEAAAKNSEKAMAMMQKMNEEGNRTLREFLEKSQKEARLREQELMERVEQTESMRAQQAQEMQKQINAQQNEFMLFAQKLAERPPPPPPSIEQGQPSNPLAGITSLVSGVGGLFGALTNAKGAFGGLF